MKTTILTTTAIAIFSLAAMADSSFGQGLSTKVKQLHNLHGNSKQLQAFKHQGGKHQGGKHQGGKNKGGKQKVGKYYGGQHQQFIVPPGYHQPTPKLGFQGQILGGYGMKVVSVNWGTPAQKVGLESGDVITQINGRQIRSQWDYDQALRNAAKYHSGRVNLLVRNVRFDWGWKVPEYVSSTTFLQGFGYPAGPIGPQSVGRQVAAQQR